VERYGKGLAEVELPFPAMLRRQPQQQAPQHPQRSTVRNDDYAIALRQR
jgi:hypothetical protein